MSISTFLELVEIKAKPASVMPFSLGLCFSTYYYNSINWGVSIVFFIAMFMFNMVVDMLANYKFNHQYAIRFSTYWNLLIFTSSLGSSLYGYVLLLHWF